MAKDKPNGFTTVKQLAEYFNVSYDKIRQQVEKILPDHEKGKMLTPKETEKFVKDLEG